MASRLTRRTSLVFVVFFGVTALFSVGACASRVAPIYNVANHPISAAAQKLPQHSIEQAIIDAALSYHWHIDSSAPGKIGASYERNGHEAAIAISYSQTAYSITLVHSSGLLQEDGEIHHNYNRWIRNLEKGIEDRLAAATMSAK